MNKLVKSKRRIQDIARMAIAIARRCVYICIYMYVYIIIMHPRFLCSALNLPLRVHGSISAALYTDTYNVYYIEDYGFGG